jgi:4-carboxymuconolactone decarboxylase
VTGESSQTSGCPCGGAAETGRHVREQLFGALGGEVPSPAHRAVLDELVNNALFGQVWADETLPLRQRSLLTMAVLVTQGREAQLRTHVKAALRLGIPEQEITAMMTHVAFYAGVPAAYTGLAVAKSVFDDRVD